MRPIRVSLLRSRFVWEMRVRARIRTRVQLVSSRVRLSRRRCVYARARTRESLRMSLVTPGVTPGFALTIPGYQHRPPFTTDREELHYALLTILAPCAKHCRTPPRCCSLCAGICIALIRLRFCLIDVNRIPRSRSFLQIFERFGRLRHFCIFASNHVYVVDDR